MKRKLHRGQVAVEYLAITAVIVIALIVDTEFTDGQGNSVISNIISIFQNQWSGFSFMVSLPLD